QPQERQRRHGGGHLLVGAQLGERLERDALVGQLDEPPGDAVTVEEDELFLGGEGGQRDVGAAERDEVAGGHGDRLLTANLDGPALARFGEGTGGGGAVGGLDGERRLGGSSVSRKGAKEDAKSATKTQGSPGCRSGREGHAS